MIVSVSKELAMASLVAMLSFNLIGVVRDLRSDGPAGASEIRGGVVGLFVVFGIVQSVLVLVLWTGPSPPRSLEDLKIGAISLVASLWLTEIVYVSVREMWRRRVSPLRQPRFLAALASYGCLVSFLNLLRPALP